MDPKDNRSKAKQAAKEPSRKSRWLNINKGTRNLIATNNYNNMRAQFAGFQHQPFKTTSSMPPSINMPFVQQYQTPLSDGNANFVSYWPYMTTPPTHNYMQDPNYFVYGNNINFDVGKYINYVQQPCNNSESLVHLARPLVNTGGRGFLLQRRDIGWCQNGNSVAVSSQNGNFVAGQDSDSILGKRSFGRFFLENGIGSSAIASLNFCSMMDALQRGDEMNQCIPRIADELKGYMSDDELHKTDNYVNNVRLSWPHKGCSILLDGWTDHLGRSLMNVVVDSPEGPIYLCSADISPSTKGPKALQVLLEDVLKDVGVQNVIQIVAHTSSDSLEEVKKQLTEKHRSLFWTVSATHCLSLILDKIAMIGPIKITLDEAKSMTKFIYSRAPVLRLCKKYICSHDLVGTSRINSAVPFFTLGKFRMERHNLELMFTSSEWESSTWAKSPQGIKIAGIVRDSSFWDRVTFAVNASIPVAKAIASINEDTIPHMNFIYEMMDTVKESICNLLGRNEDQYTPIWKIIDEIWNTVLHSPLHAAGYFLNPRLHYAQDFYVDDEVDGGLRTTIDRMAGDQRTHELVSQQLSVYKGCEGDFKMGTDNNCQNKHYPAQWWALFGGHCPDLQKLAIRILSQNCNGVEVYGLRRDLAEKALSTDGSVIEHIKLRNLAYVYYNLRLKQYKMGTNSNIVSNEMDLPKEWIVDEAYQAEGEDSGSTSMVNTVLEVGSSSGVAIKIEPDDSFV